jgi:membrane protease YdiL (CAAX protease family)
MLMTSPRALPPHSKSVLVDGAVRPWHIVFLFTVCWAVGIVSSFYLTKSEDSAYRGELRLLAFQALYGGLLLAITVIVPELRRSLPLLFARKVVTWNRRDLALVFLLLLLWGYGVYRIAICFPAIVINLEAFRIFRFYESPSPFATKELVFLFFSVLFAPLAEELVFRGFLLNLWIARWGTWPAIWISSIVFGLYHFELAIFATGCGVIFALVYLRFNSLWPAFILHGAYNLLASSWLLGRFFYVKERATADQITNWIPELILALLFVPVLILFLRRFNPGRGQ